MSCQDEGAPLTPSKWQSLIDFADTTFAVQVLGLDCARDVDFTESSLIAQALKLGLPVSSPPQPLRPPPSIPPRRPSLVIDGRSESVDSHASRTSGSTTDYSKSLGKISKESDSTRHNRTGSRTSITSCSHDSVLSQSLTPIPANLKPPGHASLSPTRRSTSNHSTDTTSLHPSPHRSLIKRLSRLRLRNKSPRAVATSDEDIAEPMSQNTEWHDGTILSSLQSGDRGRPSQDDLTTARSPPTSKVYDNGSESNKATDNHAHAMQIPAYVYLRRKHIQQRDRYLCWVSEYKESLTMTSSRRGRDVAYEFDQQYDARIERYTSIIADVEDKHIAGEAKLRAAQDTERRNSQTALKHMESYCRGETVQGQPHQRDISEQDRQELAKAQWLRDNMSIRHQSAINVLRGEQTRRLQARETRHDQDLEKLQRLREREIQRIEHDLHSDLSEWELQTRAKQAMLERWWLMETQICVKEHWETIGLVAGDTFPPMPWCEGISLRCSLKEVRETLDEQEEDTSSGSLATPTTP